MSGLIVILIWLRADDLDVGKRLRGRTERLFMIRLYWNGFMGQGIWEIIIRWIEWLL